MKKLLTILFAVALGLNLSAQVPDYVPTEGLVAWYPFNGNANDESGNGNDGVINGTVEFDLSNALFNGIGYIETPVVLDLEELEFLLSNDSSEYFFHENEMSWAQAAEYAVSLGGHLVTFSSLEENVTVFDAFESVADPMNGCFIGLFQDLNSSEYFEPDGGWEWVTGEPMEWSNWHSGEPNSGGNYGNENVGSFHGLAAGGWNDVYDGLSFPFIVEFSVQTSILGCTDPIACNYDSDATSDNGSCIPSGCMESAACNYNELAECDGEACDYSCCPGPGCCGEGTTWNSLEQTCESIPCETILDPLACGLGTYWDETLSQCLPLLTCQEDLDGDGVIGINDLMQLLSSFGTMCEEPETAEFSCGDPMNYHGYDYATVQIGDQCWFRENLRNEHYANGDAIPGDLSNSEWESTTEGAQAIYNNDASNLVDYGRLYNWYAVDDARGLCPTGWHVPTDGDFMTLEVELGLSEAEANSFGWRGSNQGYRMKSSIFWDGSNTTGFSMLHGGLRNPNGEFGFENNSGLVWSKSITANSGISRAFGTGYDSINKDSDHKNRGFSVRCLKDTEE